MRFILHRQLATNLQRKSILAGNRQFTLPARLFWKSNYARGFEHHVNTSRQASTGSLPEHTQGQYPKQDDKPSNSYSHSNGISKQPLPAFDLTGRVYVVTGGASGIGLSMAEALADAGGEVHCLDRSDSPTAEYYNAAERLQHDSGHGMLHYTCVDVNDTHRLDDSIEAIGMRNHRLDGLVAAAGVVQVTPALDYKMEDARKLMDVNFIGVMATANACARQMIRHKSRGSICLIASMSGLIANKGLLSPAYNSSKAAVIQLARNLAMEWSKVQGDGSGGIRVNALSPGHVITPMVRKTFEEAPGAKEKWEVENLMGRLGDPSEFKGAALFLLSDASSFMTGNNLVIDGGHTAW